MKSNALKPLALIFAIGLILCVVGHLSISVLLKPTITEHDFHYSVTYQLNGETKTLDGIYRCKFEGYERGEEPYARYYSGEYIYDGQPTESHTYTIAELDGAELYIVTVFNEAYLMGDTNHLDYDYMLNDPYLEAVTKEGYAFEEGQMPEEFTAELISWDYPEPIENAFTFAGFSILHFGSLLITTAIGLLAIVACLIFVKRDKTVPYRALDRVSIVMNFVITLAFIPFLTVITALLQITMSGDEFAYQLFLSFPAITAFTVAASVALRRVRLSKTGFFIQFAVPVVFALMILVGSASY